MQPRIINLSEKKLVGCQMTLSLSAYNIAELWKRFMPRRNEITNAISQDVIGVAVYSSDYFSAFNPAKEFVRWATIEVSDFSAVPEGMETFTIPAGTYAVFDYKGLSTDTSIYQYIHGVWLPNSEYQLDDRPHFEVMGEKYRNNDPESEEEIWVPVKKK
jgi:AraC family transcriptional regulator